MLRTASLYSQDDPLAMAIKPRASESEPSKQLRLQQEAEAKRVSDAIDEEIKLELQKKAKSKGDVKLLLLGQAESGKSTLQKQFQLMYKPNSLEGDPWRIVIFFNIVRSIKNILITLDAWDDLVEGMAYNDDDTASVVTAYPRQHVSMADQPSPTASLLDVSTKDEHEVPLRSETPAASISLDHGSQQIAQLRRRLGPLVATDDQLASRLNGGANATTSGKVLVRSGWESKAIQGALGRAKWGRRNADHKRSESLEEPSLEGSRTDSLVEDVGRMLDACKEDIKALWTHSSTRGLISRRKLKLDEWSEYFLNDIIRVSATGYVPTTDDILHARIATLGVSEHSFEISIHGKQATWRLYDVGGARGQRSSWVPYFDDAAAIIFLCNVAGVDQYLEEDPRVNRIDDSLQLFTQICTNPLLKQVHLVLFLNKTDLLQAKLAKGLKVQKYITSFGQRSNDYETVSQYFRAHFMQVHRKNNETKRVLYTHFTSMVDTRTTQSVIGNVRDSIFRGYLKSASLV